MVHVCGCCRAAYEGEVPRCVMPGCGVRVCIACDEEHQAGHAIAAEAARPVENRSHETPVENRSHAHNRSHAAVRHGGFDRVEVIPGAT